MSRLNKVIASKVVGQPEHLVGLFDLGSNLPYLTTRVGRVLLGPTSDFFLLPKFQRVEPNFQELVIINRLYVYVMDWLERSSGLTGVRVYSSSHPSTYT